MGMIPEGTRLISSLEIIEERIIRSNRTLCNESHAIGPIRLFLLEYSMPMLFVMSIGLKNDTVQRRTMLVLRNILASVNWSMTWIWKRSPLLPRITGPGKVPPARTALNRAYEKLREPTTTKIPHDLTKPSGLTTLFWMGNWTMGPTERAFVVNKSRWMRVYRRWIVFSIAVREVGRDKEVRVKWPLLLKGRPSSNTYMTYPRVHADKLSPYVQ